MKLTFLGAAHEVTGSCTLLEACGKKILIDCGMEQGADIYENCDLPVAPTEIDCLCLTHAHMDHSGKIPALVANGYSGPVYATEATVKLCEIMLRDSAHIQEFEAQWRNRKAKRAGGEPYVPLYTMADVEKTLPLFHGLPYEQAFAVAPGITIRFRDAGHLLGSASVTLQVTENGTTETLLFSGDIGNVNRPLIRDPQKPDAADYVVIESTYGDRLHGERPDYAARLAEIIQTTMDRGGNVVVPCFAIGRTQELLYLLRQIKEQGLVQGHDGFPVYVDSPLAVEATQIYSAGSEMAAYYDAETLRLLRQGINPIGFSGLRLSVTSDDSRAINEDDTPKVILSASGMCEAGRIRHHLKHNLWRADSTVLFVGYQAEGTLGRRLVDGASEVKLFGEEIAVHAQIAQLAGISGHADRGMLLDWLRALQAPPKRVFVNHGEDRVCDLFAAEVEQTLRCPATAPYSGDAYDLATGECVQKGKIVKISKRAYAQRRNNAVYERLLAAGRHLLAVIEQNRGGANKELAGFADQIQALADRYARKK